jgi:hypothetical protein
VAMDGKASRVFNRVDAEELLVRNLITQGEDPVSCDLDVRCWMPELKRSVFVLVDQYCVARGVSR